MEIENTNSTTNQNRGFDKRFGIGILLLVIGGLILLSNFHLIPYEVKHYIFTWKSLLIGIGVISLLSNDNKVPGIIMICIGAFFFIPDFLDLTFRFRKLFWPVLFIGIGLMFIFRKRINYNAKVPPYSTTSNSSDYIDEIAIFGGGDRKITTKLFKGGRVTSIFGGSTFDFSDADLAEGVHVIDVFSCFGGSKFIVPTDWEVKTDVVSIFGGFNDKRKNLVNTNGNNKIIIFKGLVVFGGGEIKSF